MGFSFNFEPVLAESDLILHGIMLTILLSACSIIIGTTLAVVLVALRGLGGRLVAFVVDTYVELLRNTPFLIQLFMIFFGLPLLGLRMSGFQAGLLAMTMNLSAYATEIIRAGVDATHKSQLEAGLSLAMSRIQIYRHVVLKPAFAKVWPALSSQFVLMLLASSICSFISVPELSGSAAIVEQRTFRSFETYIVVTIAYLVLALVLRLALIWLGDRLFAKRVRPTVSHGVNKGSAA